MVLTGDSPMGVEVLAAVTSNLLSQRKRCENDLDSWRPARAPAPRTSGPPLAYIFKSLSGDGDVPVVAGTPSNANVRRYRSLPLRNKPGV